MAYVRPNLKSKKAIREAIATGKRIEVFDPGIGHEPIPRDGIVHLEGPHSPEPHKWYGTGTMKDGKLVSIS